MVTSMRLALIVLALLGTAQASELTPKERAFELRRLVQTTAKSDKASAKVVKLPVSRGFDQKDTSLCWVYSFLNAQETIFRVKNPGQELELSRAALQYRTMEDRLLRHARRSENTPNMMKESGTPVDAWALAKKHGLVAFADFRDILPQWMVPHYQVVAISVAKAESPAEQETILTTELEKLFGVLPTQTHLGVQALAPVELAEKVLAGQEWVSYAPGTQEALGPHADTDARPESQTFYTSLENIKRHVTEALKAGSPVNYTANGHVVLIYGATWDSRGKALKFHIKDSYQPFFYQADANKIFKELVEISVLKN